MSIRVEHDLHAFAADLAAQPVKEARETVNVVRKAAQRGNTAAKGYAKASAGSHGKHYHRAFTSELLSPRSAEYGPDAARPQGGMSFEFGSRNQPPHLDLAKSAPIAAAELARGVRDMLDGLYW